MRHAPSPAMLLLLLFLGIELATFACSCRGLKSDVAAAARKHGGAALWAARAPPRTAPTGVGGDTGAWAVQGESKRLVPQGPNPLHN
ncbi:hypothetical protein BAE44_0021505 [Dichanthelium oligosanthes]|uniref:Uncharacterized protein n=1 Tax=Dichanthelium oligosanthes TaxID=888268 RepID=A0A1E5UX98_9POAL|nr:hypothetical protein BAE44_0021505 [Dichanthelium oligosanthes]